MLSTPIGPPREISKILAFFRPTQKMGPDGPKWGKEDFVLANPDLADILDRTNLDFEHFLIFGMFGNGNRIWGYGSNPGRVIHPFNQTQTRLGPGSGIFQTPFCGNL